MVRKPDLIPPQDATATQPGSVQSVLRNKFTRLIAALASSSIVVTTSSLGLRSRSPARRGRDGRALVLLGDARRPHGLPFALRDPRSSRHRARGPQRDVPPVSTNSSRLNTLDSRADFASLKTHPQVPGRGPGLDARSGRLLLPVHPDVFSSVRRRAPALAAPDHRVRAPLRRRVDERAGRRVGACSLQGVHKYDCISVLKILDVHAGYVRVTRGEVRDRTGHGGATAVYTWVVL